MAPFTVSAGTGRLPAGPPAGGGEAFYSLVLLLQGSHRVGSSGRFDGLLGGQSVLVTLDFHVFLHQTDVSDARGAAHQWRTAKYGAAYDFPFSAALLMGYYSTRIYCVDDGQRIHALQVFLPTFTPRRD